MSMTDPIADLLTRNPQRPDRWQARSADGVVEAEDGHRQGFERRRLYRGFRTETDGGQTNVDRGLKYYEGRPVMTGSSVSAGPACGSTRQDELPKVLGGMGTVIVSTPGCDDGQAGRSIGQGGEVLCVVA